MKIVIESKSEVSQNTPKWILSESPNPSCSRIPPKNENFHTVQIQGVPKYSPQMKIVIESKSEVFQIPLKIKIVIESKNQGVPEYCPPNENCQRVQIQGVPKYSPQMKIVKESKSKVSQNIPPKWKLSYSPNLRCPRKPPNENCQRVQIWGVPESPLKMKIVIESKSKVSQNTPQNENCPWIWILWQFSFGGIFRDTLDLDSLTIFIGGEHSGTPQIWTLWQNSFGSILGHLRFGLYDNFHLGGVFWDTLDFFSMTIFILKVEYSGTPFFLTPWKFSFWGYLEHLGFGLYDNFHFGGLFWDTSDLDSMTILIWGGILGHLRFGLPDNFHFGAYSGTPWIWTLSQLSIWGGILGHLRFGLSDNFHLGVFWDTSDLDCMTIFIFGGYSGTPWIWTLWQFSFGGSILGTPQIWTLWQYSFGGQYSGTPWFFDSMTIFILSGIWNTSDLDSMTIFIWGEYSRDTLDFYSMTIFILKGEYSGTPFFLDSLRIFILGVFWNTSDLDSMTIFISGGYSGTPWIWTLWQFSFRGILGHLGFGFYDNFHLEGVFWDTSYLDSMTIFILRGDSGTPRIWTVWQFSFWGGVF